jgi:hypothetical protein
MGTFFGRQVGVQSWAVPWDNWLAGIKHGCPEAIKIGLGDTREVCWLGDGSTLHVVELEECRDHHLVVKWQQNLYSWLTALVVIRMNPPLNSLMPCVIRAM